MTEHTLSDWTASPEEQETMGAASADKSDGSQIVTGVMRFCAGPGREAEAAEAWAFELKYYFLRRVGERPQVTYSGGVYTCSGLVTTSHPGDRSPVTVFEPTADLDYCIDPRRTESLRELYEGPTWG